MHPEIFRIPGLGWPIHSYGLLIVTGFLLATFLAHREAKRRGLPDFVYDLGFTMLLAGILGGRLWYYIEFYRTEFADRSFLAFFEIWKGGLVFYGGAVAGALGALGYLKWRKLDVGDCLDAISPFILIAMAFGRLGCFMYGCCFGKVCGAGFPLGLTFPRFNIPGDAHESPAYQEQAERGLVVPPDATSLPVYPTQLMEAGYDILLCATAYVYLRGRVPRYVGFPLVFVFYAIGRFFLEFLRGDNPPTFSGFTTSQNFSLAAIAVFGIVLIFLYSKALVHSAEASPKKI